MYENTSVSLGGKNYEFSDWNILKVLRWQRRIVGKVGKSLPHLVNDKAGSMPTGEELEKVVAGFLDDLDEDTLIDWISDILNGVRCEGNDVNINHHFRGGDSLNLYKLVYEVFKWQFRDFFSGFQGLEKIKATVKDYMHK